MAIGNHAVGTVRAIRRGLPVALKNIKLFEKKSVRCDMRWRREEDVLTIQWRDNKTISVMSTMHDANEFSSCKRWIKDKNGKFNSVGV